LLIILMIYMAWRYNANKIRQEQQMRTAIASDLHDEIGSTLTRISINSELLTMGEIADKEALETISSDSKKAISSISDIIWSVDARNDNKEDLVLRMKDHAHKMLEDIAEVHYSVSGLSSTINIPQSLRQNIYLIFKEAVNNIIRHNISPEVWISLENGPAGFVMEVKNTIQHKKGTGYKGQGLRNMEMRAKRINASVNVAETDGIFSVTLRMKEWK
jgi:signal transduction histidine kinase